MVLVICENCQTVQEYSIPERDTPCRACGASSGHLSPVTEDPDIDPSGSRSYTVLIAEDDDAFRELVTEWSDVDDTWHVREALDGDEVLELVDEDVDVLVLDRRLPELSGAEVIDRLEDTPFDGAILVVSAYEADMQLGEADVAGYVTKPISRETYVQALKQIVAE